MLDTFTHVCSHKDNHGILVVGEGNFSFAKDLAKYEKNVSIYATSFDSKEVVFADQFAEENIKVIKCFENVTVQHSIDATCLDNFFFDKIFSVIIFNFPHTGGKSNIKKCRRLLEDFFESTPKCLCSEGNVIVSLCKGQGGTPVDASRGNYGNTWKVASCASKSGFILRDLIPFDSSSLENYCEAGYRGVIRQKFFTSKGLIHIFQKGRKQEDTLIKILEEEREIEQLDQILTGQSKIEYVYNSYFKNKRNILYDTLEEIISASVTEKFQELSIKCMDVDWSVMPGDSLSNQFTIHNKTIFLPCGNTFDKASIPCQYDNFKLSFYSINNKSANISPFSCYFSHQINFILNTQKIGIDNCDLECSILQQIQAVILKHHKPVIVDCVCNMQDMTECACIIDQASICCKPYLKYFSCESCYDVEDVPNFLEDIPVAFWTSFQPEIIVSYKNKDDEIEYQKQECNKYELNKIERNYCSANISSNVNHTNNKSVKKVLVSGRCIATISNIIDIHGHNRLILTFYSNEVFLLFYVPDLRYLWCDDEIFHADILKHMQYDKGNSCFHSYVNHYQTLIKHPLCYRHDLCFWLDEVHTEEHLIECIRLMTFNVVHSVRLIKVLRHEETSCVSYCYRMIHGRLDGPMSHDDSVQLQNKLRVFLLHLGYVLR